jgi:ligand-binding sensor domain-containing protein/signal transduction histidine kinase
MKLYCSFIGIILCVFSCNDQDEITNPLSLGPTVVETKGYVVTLDSMPKPKVVPAINSVIVPVGNPKVVPININIHNTGKPKVVLAGVPKLSTPGRDSFSLPKIVPAIDSRFTAGIPEVVIAKEGYSKDQNPQNFSSFSKLQGLKSEVITCVLEDKPGNLWFGTAGAGISKYDGKNFTHFTNKEGLSGNAVYCMLEDRNGNIWIGTDKGLNKYDGKQITRFTDKEGLSNNWISTMLENKRDGNLWFGTKRGAAKYDGKNFTIFTKKEGLSSNWVTSILEDKRGNLWFGTYENGINKYDGKNFFHFTEEEGLSKNDIKSMFEDRNGDLWFGTNGGGVCKYNETSFVHYTEKEGLSKNEVYSIMQDGRGDLWFGTFGGGVSKFNGEQFIKLTDKEGLSNNVVWGLLEDRSGNVWIATLGGGVNKYNGQRFTHITEREGLNNSSVNNILKEKNGNLWFGTGGGGIIKYDGKSFTYFIDKRGLTYNDIWSMLEDRMGNLWIGTYGGGVSKYDGKTFTRFTMKEGLSANGVFSILEDKRGNLWFGTEEGGVSKYDGKTFTHINTEQGLAGNIILDMLEDKNGNIWFGTNGGISKYDGRSFTNFTRNEGLTTGGISSLLEDKHGNLWFGTYENGVYKYDGKKFTLFTEKEGLSNNTVFSLLEDKNGNLWFGTPFGLNKLKKDKLSTLNKDLPLSGGIFKQYTHEDGFSGVGVNIRKTLCETPDGKIWIGANGMLTVYHPERESLDTTAPNLQIINIELFNETIPWQNLEKKKDTSIVLQNGIRLHHLRFNSVSKWYGVPENLSLPYNNNYLTFHFIGITTSSPQKIKYQFKLEGLDKNWSVLNNRTEAHYGNLPHGKYTFKIKAMNSDGYWSKESNYSFIVRPPWWYTWWAYCLYLLIFLAAAWAIYRYQKQKIIQVEQEKAKEKELAHAKEIEKAYYQLQNTQAQLVQREKMASLGELTAGIAHEIQNPLNFVNNFSEVNSDLIEEMKQEIEKGNMEEAKALANHVKENQERINQYGKRADGIVKGMLQHSRTSKGQKEPTDINDLVDEYLRLSYHGLRAKEHSFTTTLQTDFDTSIGKINIIPEDIGRVLLNLFNNALYAVGEKKKMPGENYEPIVAVSTKKINDKIEIKIKDNGNGIRQKVVDKIFQPFFTTKPAGHGTGLGLSLSYDIIKAHGGEIKVNTTEGEFAEFVIRLPLTV